MTIMRQGFLQNHRFFRSLAVAACGALLFSALSAPWAEASFWQDRRAAAQKKTSSEAGETQYAALPANFSSLNQTLPAPTVAPRLRLTPGLNMGTRVHRPVPAGAPGWATALPASAAQLTQISPVRSSKPWVVLVQEAHNIPSAQRNISALLSALAPVLKDEPLTVGLEGAHGAFTLASFRAEPNLDAHSAAVEYLLTEGDISGPEHYALMAPQEPVLWGVDDENLYLENVRAYRESRPLVKSFLENLSALRVSLEPLQERLYTLAQKSFDQRMAAFHKGDLDLLGHVEFLAAAEPEALAQGLPEIHRLLSARKIEKSMDFQTVEAERARLLEVLSRRLTPRETEVLVHESSAYRKGDISYGDFYASLKNLLEKKGVKLSMAPAFDRYVQYVLLTEKIDSGRLFAEVDALEERVIGRIFNTPDQRALLRLSQDASLLERLARHSFTPADWTAYQNRRREINMLPARLAALARRVDLEASAKMPEDTLRVFERFYQAALARNDAMARHFEEKVASTKAPFAVLVAGGFHAPGLRDILTARGYSVLTVTPKMGDVKDVPNYLDVFAANVTPLDRLFLGDKLFLRYQLGAADRPFKDFHQAKAKLTEKYVALIALMTGEAESLRARFNFSLLEVSRRAVADNTLQLTLRAVKDNFVVSFKVLYQRGPQNKITTTWLPAGPWQWLLVRWQALALSARSQGASWAVAKSAGLGRILARPLFWQFAVGSGVIFLSSSPLVPLNILGLSMAGLWLGLNVFGPVMTGEQAAESPSPEKSFPAGTRALTLPLTYQAARPFYRWFHLGVNRKIFNPGTPPIPEKLWAERVFAPKFPLEIFLLAALGGFKSGRERLVEMHKDTTEDPVERETNRKKRLWGIEIIFTNSLHAGYIAFVGAFVLLIGVIPLAAYLDVHFGFGWALAVVLIDTLGLPFIVGILGQIGEHYRYNRDYGDKAPLTLGSPPTAAPPSSAGASAGEVYENWRLSLPPVENPLAAFSVPANQVSERLLQGNPQIAPVVDQFMGGPDAAEAKDQYPAWALRVLALLQKLSPTEARAVDITGFLNVLAGVGASLNQKRGFESLALQLKSVLSGEKLPAFSTQAPGGAGYVDMSGLTAEDMVRPSVRQYLDLIITDQTVLLTADADQTAELVKFWPQGTHFPRQVITLSQLVRQNPGSIPQVDMATVERLLDGGNKPTLLVQVVPKDKKRLVEFIPDPNDPGFAIYAFWDGLFFDVTQFKISSFLDTLQTIRDTIAAMA